MVESGHIFIYFNFYLQACLKVVKFINYYRSRIIESLDGKNQEAILSDLGVKIHRTIFEHFQQFQFNIVGM